MYRTNCLLMRLSDNCKVKWKLLKILFIFCPHININQSIIPYRKGIKET